MAPAVEGLRREAPSHEKQSTRSARRARKAQAGSVPVLLPELTCVVVQSAERSLAANEAEATSPRSTCSLEATSPRSSCSSEATSPRSTCSSDTSLSPRCEPPLPISTPPPCASWPTPLYVLCVILAQLSLVVAQLWNIAAGIVFVLPTRMLASLGAPSILLSVARRVAQSPLLLTASIFAVPLFLREGSYGVDIAALPRRPSTLDELIGFLKPGRARSWAKRVARAQKGLAAAGITAVVVPTGSFSPGVAHRRVVLAHVLAKNSGWGRLFWLAQTVAALHSFHASAVEFRDSSGLVALSVQVRLGCYACGVLFAAKPAASHSGVWLSNLALVLPMLCQGGALQHALVFDAGPSFGELKSTLGLAPLPCGRTLRAALS